MPVLLAIALAPAACNSNKACCSDDKSDKMAERAIGAPAQNNSTNSPQATKVAATKTVNSICPIGGDEFNPEGHPAELVRVSGDTKIGFCCPNCAKKFDAMDANAKQQVVNLARANKSE
jgi:hypothetical protein